MKDRKCQAGLSVLMSFLLIASIVSMAYGATEQISVVRTAPESATAGDEVTINLTVDVDETNLPAVYILYEYIPQEFTVTSYGGGSASEIDGQKIIKWVRFGMFGTSIKDAQYSYKVKAYEAGDYLLNGTTTTESGLYVIGGASNLEIVAAPTDSDADGLLDSEDNCPLAQNADQADFDGDGEGDVCDSDDDNDGDPDESDCATMNDAIYTGAQEICDNSIDENCDGEDTECGVDSDGDSVEDANDNCPGVYNPTQANYDGDSMGDACDSDDDNDSDPDSTDCAPKNALINNGATDVCGNGIDEDCDGSDLVCIGPIQSTRDIDDDAAVGEEFDVNIFVNVDESDKPSVYILKETIPSGITLTDLGGGSYDASTRILQWRVYESTYYGTVVEDRTFTYSAITQAEGLYTFTGTVQANSVYYGTAGEQTLDLGGSAVTDSDGDGFDDESDNCPYTANANQADSDGDGQGNACDSDDDNDGDADTTDCAPFDNTRYNGAPELCGNGIDDDCDSSVDENCDVCVDSDGDGYGSPASGICEFATLDCDDSSADVYPGAVEICGNGIDEDCSGSDQACAIEYPISVSDIRIVDNSGNTLEEVSPGSQFYVNITYENQGEKTLAPMMIAMITHDDEVIDMGVATISSLGAGNIIGFGVMINLPDSADAGEYKVKAMSWNHWASQEGWEPLSESLTATFTVA